MRFDLLKVYGADGGEAGNAFENFAFLRMSCVQNYDDVLNAWCRWFIAAYLLQSQQMTKDWTWALLAVANRFVSTWSVELLVV